MEKYEVINPEKDIENYQLDKKVINKLTAIFSSIQGDEYQKHTNKGNVNIKRFIDFKLDKSKVKFFDKTKKIQFRHNEI